MYPTDRRYSKEHEWITVDQEQGTIGITLYAQEQLGDVVYVELPEVGAEFQTEDVLGTIESVKAVSEVFSPVGGTVVEVNGALEQTPELLNRDPHGEGWYCKLRLSAPSEVEELMDAAGYQSFVESE